MVIQGHSVLKRLHNGGANLVFPLLWACGENSSDDFPTTVDHNILGCAHNIEKPKCFSVESFSVKHLRPADSFCLDHLV